MPSGAMWIMLIKDESRPLRLRLRSVFSVLLLAFLALVLGVTGMVMGVRMLAANTDLRRELQTLSQNMIMGEENLTALQLRINGLEARYSALPNPDTPPEDIPPVDTPPADTPPEETQPPDEAQGPPIDLPALFAHVDLGVMVADNLVFTRQGESGLRVSFDLTNRSGALQSGDGEVLLITRDGREIAMTLVGGNMNFEIRNFKKVAATVALPPGLPWEETYALALRLRDQDNRTLLRLFRPLPAP